MTAQNLVRFSLKPTEDRHACGVFTSWLSEDGRYKITRVDNHFNKEGPYYCALRRHAKAYAQDGFDPVGHESLGVTYVKQYRNAAQAIAAIETADGVAVYDRNRLLQALEGDDEMTTATVKGKKMRLTRDQAITLLKGIGLTAKVETFDNDRLQKKVSRLAELDESQIPDNLSEEVKTLFDDVLKSIEDGEGVLVKGGEEAKPAKDKLAKPIKGKPVDENKEKSRGAEDVAKRRGPRGVGVIATIIECLSKASAKAPASIDSIHKALVKKFTDRDPKSMLSTIRSQVPSGLRVEKKVEVSKNDNGYWLPKEEQAKLKR